MRSWALGRCAAGAAAAKGRLVRALRGYAVAEQAGAYGACPQPVVAAPGLAVLPASAATSAGNALRSENRQSGIGAIPALAHLAWPRTL